MKKIFIIIAIVIAMILSLPLSTMAGVDPDCDLVFGITSSGEIHEVNPNDGTYTKVGEIYNCINTHASGPNGLAYHPQTNRIYYTEYPDQNGDNETDFYYIDLGTGVEVYVGTLPGEIADADIYQGKYYYIAGGQITGFTDDLYEVALDVATGNVTSITKVADISGNVHAYGFWGDIAISADGLIYGVGDCKVSGHNDFDLFTFNLDGSGFVIHSQVSMPLQLAFGCDGTLYGHEFGTGHFYEIDIENWVVKPDILSTGEGYCDLASRPCVGSIEILKLDYITRQKLGGAVFSVSPDPYDYDGELIVADNTPPDSDPTWGVVLLENVSCGTYIVTERQAPEGYIKLTGVTIKEVSHNLTTTFTFLNRQSDGGEKDGEPPAVGIIVMPMDKAGLLLPWAVLIGLLVLATGVGLVVRRRMTR